MIATQNTKVVDSNITGRSVDMTLDVDSLQKIMNKLTDLYSDRILACIRETSTNAYDSHVEAGNNAPYEVTLPTPLDPYFRVQDWGTGLTADEFIEVYSKYGKSTRDTSNDFAGMMGLGCKAPLTYTSQYTINSVKDGVACEVLITRNEVGTSTITVISETPTDEPNGVLVEIMAVPSDINAFRDRAAKFYRFAKPGTVLVDGVEPAYLKGTEVGGSDMLIIQDPNHRNYVIMGGVGYPVAQSGEWTINHGLINGHSLAAHVPMGAVSLPPSREGLSEDKHTKDALLAITKDFHTRVAKSIQREINQCKSPYQALNALMKWNHMLPKSAQPSFADYKFQGRGIPERITLKSPGWLVPHTSPTSRGSGGMTAKTKVESIHASEINKRIIFTGWDYASFSATMRKKLDQWVHDNDLGDGGFSYLLIKEDSFSDHWFDSALVFSWDDVKKIKLESLTVDKYDRYGDLKKVRVPGSFDVITESGQTVGYPADEIDTDEPIFYYQGNMYETRRYSIVVQKLFRTGTLVAVPANRLNKFLRDFPKAQSAPTAINNAAAAWAAGIDLETRKAMYFKGQCGEVVRRIKGIDYGRLLDPAFAAYLRLADADVSKELETYTSLNGLCGYTSLSGFYKDATGDIPSDPFDAYKLATGRYNYFNVGKSNQDHFFVYANAIYSARLAGMEI